MTCRNCPMANKTGDGKLIFCTLWKRFMPPDGMCTTTLEQVEPLLERLQRFVEMLRGR